MVPELSFDRTKRSGISTAPTAAARHVSFADQRRSKVLYWLLFRSRTPEPCRRVFDARWREHPVHDETDAIRRVEVKQFVAYRSSLEWRMVD